MTDRLTPANEDYLEAIYQLGGRGASAVRSVDLAAKLDVSKASVNKAVANLKKVGLITQRPYRDITLTQRGLVYASSILERHHVLYHFLVDALGVEPLTAAVEACVMEHAISEDTLRRWAEYLGSPGSSSAGFSGSSSAGFSGSSPDTSSGSSPDGSPDNFSAVKASNPAGGAGLLLQGGDATPSVDKHGNPCADSDTTVPSRIPV